MATRHAVEIILPASEFPVEEHKEPAKKNQGTGPLLSITIEIVKSAAQSLLIIPAGLALN